MFKSKILSWGLIILIGLLGFALGSTVTQKQMEREIQKAREKTGITTIEKKEKVKKEASKLVEGEYEIYEVQEGDTLFKIGLKYGISWTKIAEVNELKEPYEIKIGQKLKIPRIKKEAEETKIEIDLTLMKELQEEVEAGKQLWRLDPVSVTKAEAPASFGFTASDIYTLKSKDLEKGEAVVEVKKEDKIYKVELIQPVKKGEEGIWAITAIKELTKSEKEK